MIEEKHTHPQKTTLGSNEASKAAKELVLEIMDIIRVEEAWAIAERHLDNAYGAGYEVGWRDAVDAARDDH